MHKGSRLFRKDKGKQPDLTAVQVRLLRLCCTIEGEKLVFPVDIPADAEVIDLKIKIHSDRVLDTLQGVGHHILELWKVCIVNVK